MQIYYHFEKLKDAFASMEDHRYDLVLLLKTMICIQTICRRLLLGMARMEMDN